MVETKTAETSKELKIFFDKYQKGLCIIGGAVGTVLLGCLGYKCILNFNAKRFAEQIKKVTTAVDDISKEAEVIYKGVHLSQLDKLAKNMYHGLGCSIDEWEFLVFKHKSHRGHKTFSTQMCVENGRLINLGGRYPNQWWSTADEFAKQANELFNFAE